VGFNLAIIKTPLDVLAASKFILTKESTTAGRIIAGHTLVKCVLLFFFFLAHFVNSKSVVSKKNDDGRIKTSERY